MTQILLENPEQLAELPAGPDYNSLPTDSLKTFIKTTSERREKINNSSNPDTVLDDLLETETHEAQDVLKERNEA